MGAIAVKFPTDRMMERAQESATDRGTDLSHELLIEVARRHIDNGFRPRRKNPVGTTTPRWVGSCNLGAGGYYEVLIVGASAKVVHAYNDDDGDEHNTVRFFTQASITQLEALLCDLDGRADSVQ